VDGRLRNITDQEQSKKIKKHCKLKMSGQAGAAGGYRAKKIDTEQEDIPAPLIQSKRI
jgi:hypothetical protein